MPARDEEHASTERETLLYRSELRVKHFWADFIDWAFQDNIIKIALGLIIASAFTDIVKSFVGDILMPPISIILPINKNIEEKFAVLKRGDNYNATTGYNTLLQAQEDGAVVMAYGGFIYQVVSFFIVGLSLYGMASIYTLISHENVIKHTKKCKYCRQRINSKAVRCLGCSSWLDGREERVSN